MIGQRFGRLIVITRALDHRQPSGRLRRYWQCRCDCGQSREINEHQLIYGRTLSCGCFHRERASEANRTHGLAHTRTYRSWYSMLRRCGKNGTYNDLGISVCERWRSFEKFLFDLGIRPIGKTLDRIDPTGHYEPGNCRWATAREQRVNRRDTKLYSYAGKTLCLTDWIREITRDPKAKVTRSAEQVRLA